MYCYNCGHEIPDESAFCPECGTKLDPLPINFSPEIKDASTNSLNKPFNQCSAQYEDKSHAHDDMLQEANPKTTRSIKQRKKLFFILVIAILLVLLAALFVIYSNRFALFNNSIADSNASNVSVKANVNDYSWEELSVISDKISAASNHDEALEIAKKYHLCNEDGTLDGTQTKDVELSNGATSSVEIIGFAHDDKANSSGKAGITFAFTEVVDYEAMSTRGSNQGGWQYSDLRAQLNSDFLNYLPEDLRSSIVEVNKSTNNVGAVYDSSNKTYDTSSISTTPDKLWLLSYTEIVGDMGIDSSKPDAKNYASLHNDEGNQYQLFADQGVQPGKAIPNVLKIKNANGVDASKAKSKNIQWLRTPSPEDKRYAYTINTSSNEYKEGHTVAYSYGIVPCFCI